MDIVIAVRSTPLFGTAPVAAILLSLAAVAAADPLSRADSLYALRAMGAEGHRAKPQPIAAAIAAYSEIAATHPRELAAQWRLLRALFFEAQYTDRSAEERDRLGTVGPRKWSPRGLAIGVGQSAIRIWHTSNRARSRVRAGRGFAVALGLARALAEDTFCFKFRASRPGTASGRAGSGSRSSTPGQSITLRQNTLAHRAASSRRGTGNAGAVGGGETG